MGVHLGPCYVSAHGAGPQRFPNMVQSLGHHDAQNTLQVRRGTLPLIPCRAGLQATQSRGPSHGEILVRIGNLAAELVSLTTRLAAAQRVDCEWRSSAELEQLSERARSTAPMVVQQQVHSTGSASNADGKCGLSQTLAPVTSQLLGEREVFRIPGAEPSREPTVAAPSSCHRVLAADPLLEEQHARPLPPSQAPRAPMLTLPLPSERVALAAATELPSVWSFKSEYIKEHSQEPERDAAPLYCDTPSSPRRGRQVSQGGGNDGSARARSQRHKSLKISISKVQQQAIGEPVSPKFVTGTKSTWAPRKHTTCSVDSHARLETEAIRKSLEKKMERVLGDSKHHCHSDFWKRFSTV